MKTEFGIIGHSMTYDRARTGLTGDCQLNDNSERGAGEKALRLAGVSMQPLKIYNL